MDDRTAVLLMSFGGPESLEEIPSFLESLLGRKPPEFLLHEVSERYRLLGGKSPLPEVTRRQAEALETRLTLLGRAWPVFVGMQHALPGIGESLEQIAQNGVHRVIAVSLAPYRSRASTQAYEETVKQAIAGRSLDLQAVFPDDWHEHPLFLDALAERLEECRRQLPAGEREQVPVIFSAHSLPVRFVEQGDPYVEQLLAAIGGVERRLSLAGGWRLAFQSKGGASREPWIDPEVEQVMDELYAQGHRTVIVDPIGFVSDHLETLYDNDIQHRRHAEKLGMKFLRCSCLNLAPLFMDALADIAVNAAGKAQFTPS